MDRNRLAIALLALLAVVGVALAATGFETPASGSGGEGEGGTGPGVTDVEGPQPVMEGFQAEFVLRLVYVAVVVALVVGVVVGALTNFVSNRSILLGVVVILLVGWALLAAVEGEGGSGFDNETNVTFNGTTIYENVSNATVPNATDEGGGSAAPPGGMLVLFAGLVLLGLFFVGQFTRGSPDEPPPEPTVDDAAEDVGRAAGRAADRIEDADLENVVYRAWRDMTEALEEPDSETSTPAEFARAAVAAGLAAEDVRELTDLFRAVRYGGVPVTAEREERARETLRRIEATYVEDGEGGDA